MRGAPSRVVLALVASVLASCIVEDGDKACGPHQTRVSGEGARYCECESGYVLDADKQTCIPCGEHEESFNGECVCVEGYARPSEGAPCSTSALGTACSESAPCMGEFPLCVEASGGDPDGSYCTFEGCKSSADCMLPGWLCQANVCKKPPYGYGRECSMPDECEGSEATYCDTFRTHSCLVQGCGRSVPCPGDWSCCDLAPFAPQPICFEPKNLVNGNCPVGMLVKP